MNPNALPDTPTAPRRIPTYRRHRPSGQAVATFGGRDFYLGAFGSKASKAEYRRRLAEWLAAGSPTYTAPEASALTVNDLILRYWRHVKAYYRPETREGTIAPTLRRLRKLYGPTLATEFGPLALKAFQRALLDERIALADPKAAPRRLSRPYINRALQWVRRLFRWAVGEQLIPPSVLQALQAVDGLKVENGPSVRRGRRWFLFSCGKSEHHAAPRSDHAAIVACDCSPHGPRSPVGETQRSQ